MESAFENLGVGKEIEEEDGKTEPELVYLSKCSKMKIYKSFREALLLKSSPWMEAMGDLNSQVKEGVERLKDVDDAQRKKRKHANSNKREANAHA